jgi:hypothetical protein
MSITRRIRPGFTAQLKVWRYRANVDMLVEISESSDTAQLAASQPPATPTPNTRTAAPMNSATNISFCVAQFDARQIQGLSDYPSRGLITNVWQGPALSGTPARLAMPEFQAFTRSQGYDATMRPVFCQPIGTSEHCQQTGSEDFLLTLRTYSAVVNCTDTLQGAEALRAELLKQFPYLQGSTWRPVGR